MVASLFGGGSVSIWRASQVSTLLPNSPDKLRKASGTFHPAMLHTKALMCLLRDTSDQLVQSRKQEL
jgi:hypothetical protein